MLSNDIIEQMLKYVPTPEEVAMLKELESQVCNSIPPCPLFDKVVKTDVLFKDCVCVCVYVACYMV